MEAAVAPSAGEDRTQKPDTHLGSRLALSGGHRPGVPHPGDRSERQPGSGAGYRTQESEQ